MQGTLRADWREIWRHDRWLMISALSIFILRTIFIWRMGLMPQDAYYYFYTEHPAISYFDHPPAIAWVLKAFTVVLGKEVWVIKLGDTLVTLGTLLVFRQLALFFLPRRRAMQGMLLLGSTLMVTILSLVSTPDVPLMLCWSLALLCLCKALFLRRRWYWLLAGAMMGLAFDSKYTAVFLPLGTGLFLLGSARYRRELLAVWPWAGLACMVLAALPVVIWNVQHDFASFRFQSAARVSGVALRLTDVLGVLGHQAALLGPVLLVMLFRAIWMYARKYSGRMWQANERTWFLLSFFLPVFCVFLALSPFYWVKLNWMMPAYITGVIWVMRCFPRKWRAWQQGIAMVIHAAMTVELLWYPVPVKSDDVWVGWGRMAYEVRKIQREFPGHFIFSADDYKTSAALNFYLDQMVYGQNIIGKPALQFDYIGTNIQNLSGRNALFINSIPDLYTDQDERRFADTLRQYFREVKQVYTIDVNKGHKLARRWLVYQCMEYRPPEE